MWTKWILNMILFDSILAQGEWKGNCVESLGRCRPVLGGKKGGEEGCRGPQGQIIQLHKHRSNLGRLAKNQEGQTFLEACFGKKNSHIEPGGDWLAGAVSWLSSWLSFLG